MVENIIFNLLAFSLFILMFFKMVKRNDTTYVSILLLQAIGIAINFISIIFGIPIAVLSKIIMYLFAIILPLVILFAEYKEINCIEVIYVLLAKAMLLFNNSKIAKNILIKLVTKYKASYLGHKILAEIYEKEGGMRKSLDEYIKAIENNKKDYNSYYKIAFLLKELDKKDEAVTILTSLLKKEPEYFKATELLGDILCDKGNYKEALSVYMNALRYNQGNYDLYYNIGMVYTMLNDFNDAKIYYQKAATLNTLLYNAYYDIGQINLLAGDLEEAEKYFNQSLSGEDISPMAYYNLAKIYMLRGEKQKAINFVNLAIELDAMYINTALEEPIFIPIKGSIRCNNIDDEDMEPRKTKFSSKEKNVYKHLDETYGIIGKMGINAMKIENQKVNEIEKQRE